MLYRGKCVVHCLCEYRWLTVELMVELSETLAHQAQVMCIGVVAV